MKLGKRLSIRSVRTSIIVPVEETREGSDPTSHAGESHLRDQHLFASQASRPMFFSSNSMGALAFGRLPGLPIRAGSHRPVLMLPPIREAVSTPRQPDTSARLSSYDGAEIPMPQRLSISS